MPDHRSRAARATAAARRTGVRGVPAALARGRERVTGVFQHRFPTVAVTGMTGVGKTELVDHLCGRAHEDGTAESGSAVMECRVRRGAGCGASASAWCPARTPPPGSAPSTRSSTTTRSTGYCTWSPTATPPVVARPAPPGWPRSRASSSWPRELEDWTVTAHRIASMAVRREYPTWLVIVVTKVDLYADDLEEVVRSYSPGSGTPFGDRLDELRALAGAAKLSIDVLPACSHLDTDAVSPKQRDAYLEALETRMAQLSGHV